MFYVYTAKAHFKTLFAYSVFDLELEVCIKITVKYRPWKMSALA